MMMMIIEQQITISSNDKQKSRIRKKSLNLMTSRRMQQVASTTTTTTTTTPKMFLNNKPQAATKAEATSSTSCSALFVNKKSNLKQPVKSLFSSKMSKFCHKLSRKNHLIMLSVLLLTVINCLSLVKCQLADISSLTDQINNNNNNNAQLQAPAPAQQQQHQSAIHQYQEILVKPNSEVRIECRLPQMTSSNLRSYYWIFQRTSASGTKPHTLCFEHKCPENFAFGIELDMDKNDNTYDLVIKNVTYELNDGLYYCDYRDTTPESKQTFSREIRLTVLISPQPPTILPAAQANQVSVAREGQEYQLNCLSHGGNPEPNITWFREDQQILPSSSSSSLISSSSAQMQMPFLMQGLKIEQSRTNGSTTSTLTWIPTIDDHQATFKCAVWNKAMQSMAPYEKDFQLQVEYAPRISVGNHHPLKVLLGSSVTLSCLVDANPPVKGIRWFKDGQLISNQFNHTLHEIKISDASVYSCQADNGIAPPSISGSLAHVGQVSSASSSLLSIFGLSNNNNNNPEKSSSTAVEAQLHLQVLYPPRVQVKPTKQGALNEGETGFALNCSVDSWPPAHEFIWTRSDDVNWKKHSTSSSYLEFQSLSAADMANYTCTASNRLEPSLQQVALDKQASGSAQVLVRHKPGLAELAILTNSHSGETELGAKTLIQCRAKPPGYPEPSYKFWKYGPLGTNGVAQKLNLKANTMSTYTIYSAKADDEAKYGCLASNELGYSTEADADLIVNEPPVIISDSSTRSQIEQRHPGDSPYSITIRATGKPLPEVTWFHRSPVDGRRVELSSSDMLTKFKIETISRQEQNHLRPKYNVYTTLTFKRPLEINDRGLYTVEFNNKLSKSAQEDFALHIYHKPIAALKNHPILSSIITQNSVNRDQQQQQPQIRTKAGFDLGETVNLTCSVSAYPRPDIYWHSHINAEQPLDANSRYKITLTNTRDDVWESTLTFSNAQEKDFGDYMCVAVNTVPVTDPTTRQTSNQMSTNVEIIVNLSSKTTPDAPYQVEPIDSNQDSITLQWIPGFDGGFALNQYLVQYAPDDGSGMSLSKRYGEQADAATTSTYNNNNNHFVMSSMSANSLDSAAQSLISTDQQQLQGEYPRLYDCYARNPCTIDHLSARQAYVFRVRAKNERGVSAFSEEIRATTRANVSQIPKILHASYDSEGNKLHFQIEPGSDYLLNNLNVRVEVRPNSPTMSSSSSTNTLQQGAANNQLDLQAAELSVQQHQQQSSGNEQQVAAVSEWRQMALVQMRQEKMDAYLNIPVDSEQLRLTLCTRSNESLCGFEYVISMKSATSSYLQAERGLSFTLVLSSLTLIIVLGAFATTLHSCCLSRKSKKVVDSVENQRTGTGGGAGAVAAGGVGTDNHAGLNSDNKPIANGHVQATTNTSSNYHHLHHHHHHLKSNGVHTHGSTTSTNSTSVAGNGNGSGGSNNGLQSMDSQLNSAHHHHHHQLAGLMSEHASSQSQMSKLDSILPPTNYNHYADRASLVLEQQQYQQQQQQQQQHLMSADKLGSPFGLPNSALLSVVQQQQQHSPSMMNGTGGQNGTGGGSLNYFGYGTANSQMELGQQQQQQQSMSLEQQQMLDAGLMLNGANLDPNEGNPPPIWQSAELDYSSYNNALGGYAHSTGAQLANQDSMLESAYGATTTGANGVLTTSSSQPTSVGLVAQQAAAYDNNANNAAGQQQYYMNAYQHQQQQQQHYQQEMAVVQQQIYGTLTRNGYNNNNNNTNNTTNNNNSIIDNIDTTNNSIKSQQQLINNNNNNNEQQYSTTNGLMQPPLPQMTSNGIGSATQQNIESDYGTIGGGRNGRLITEIIV